MDYLSLGVCRAYVITNLHHVDITRYNTNIMMCVKFNILCYFSML